jgi:aryl-alcohol dehydrogenase-like predicted oxidoreductase
MDYSTLGRTRLKVGVAGLGCGGNSKIGLGAGQGARQSDADSIALIHRALDLGVNFLDTARAYGTEQVVGAAIKTVPRESVIVSSKHQAGPKVTAAALATEIDASLRDLQTDYVDIFHLHGVRPEHYGRALNDLVPVLLQARDAGKIRFLGITETSPNDHGQTMLNRAAGDGCWDVMMLGFNMMHQVARSALLPQTMEHGIGTLIMFAVRNLFSVPGRLQETMHELAADGRVPDWLAENEDPLGFLVHPEDGGAVSVIEAAYRYARHEPGADVVLFGTGQVAHLEANIASILKPPLPAADTARLAELFGHLEGVGLDLPGPA